MTRSQPRRDVLRLGAASGAALLVPATVTASRATAAPSTSAGRWWATPASARSSPRAPPARAPAATGNLRLGVVSCANYQAGYFSAYRQLAARGVLDAVLHLGDYLYEYAPERVPGRATSWSARTTRRAR